MPAKSQKNPTKDYKQFLDKFNEIFERNFRVTPNLVAKLQTRLKTFTLDEVMVSLDKLGQWEFAHGDNDRGWQANPNYLLRNDDQIDRFLNKPDVKQRIKESFEAPSPRVSAEIRVMAGLITGVWDNSVDIVYRDQFIPWMRSKNLPVKFPQASRGLAKFLTNHNPPFSVNALSRETARQRYEQYVSSCIAVKTDPHPEIVQAWEQS